MDYAKVLREARAEAAKAIAAAREEADEFAFNCGFAWVIVRPATCGFIRYCRKEIDTATANLEGREKVLAKQTLGRFYGSKSWNGGWCFWKPGWECYNGQSIEVYVAGARAFATVLKKYGIKAEVDSRLD